MTTSEVLVGIVQLLETHGGYGPLTPKQTDRLRTGITLRAHDLGLEGDQAYYQFLTENVQELELLCTFLHEKNLGSSELPSGKQIDRLELEVALMRQLLKQRTEDLESANRKLMQHNAELQEQNTRLEEQAQGIEASEHRFDASFNNAPVGMVKARLDGTLLQVNQVFCKLVGYSRDELVGLHISALTPSEDQPADRENYLELLEGTKLSYQLEKHYRHKDSHLVHCLISVNLVFAANGQPDYLLSQVLDLTDKDHLEIERRKAQLKLKDRDRRFSDLGSNVPGMIYQLILEPTGKISIPYVSEGCTTMFELSVEEAVQDASYLVGRIHPDDVDRFHDSLIESSLTMEIWKWDGRIISMGGQVKWVRNIARPGMYKQKFTLWNGVMTDITEQKLAQQEMSNRQRLYRLVTEHSTDVVSLFDAEQNLRYLSPSIESLVGFTVDEIISIGMPSLIHPEDREYVRDEILRTTANQVENSRYSCRMCKKDGSHIWVEVVAKREYNEQGEIVQTIANLRDVNNQMVAENRLKRSEMQYRLLAENSKDLICLHQLDRTYSFISPSIKELTGYEHKELLGKDPLGFVHPDDRTVFLRKSGAQLVFTQKPTQVEYRFQRKDGSYIWLSTATIPVRNDENAVVRYQSSSRDITLQKESEQSLIEAKNRAEQAVQAKQQFLSNMSHEIRTPMNAVVGLTHLLEQENPREDQLDHLKTLKFSADNLLMIINDILDYAKIEEGKIIFEETNFNLDELLGNLFQSFSTKAEAKGINLRFEKSPHLPYLLIGDSGRLAQVLYNLLGNAIKFTEEGSVQLYIEERKRSEDWIELRFSVIDTGIGIAQKKLDVIFDRFSQANSETNRKYGGTGLGLAITKRLLELQKSTLKVKSTKGEGSKFYFRLRFRTGLTVEKSARKKTTKAIAYKSLRHIRLLLVEDNKVNQMVATKFLQKWDIQPDHAEDGLEAIEQMHKNPYDIVLMDLQMPKMDGYEATKEIRKFNKEVPIIALTASAMGDTRERVLSIGMTDYISKPFNPADLYLKLMKFARKKPGSRKT